MAAADDPQTVGEAAWVHDPDGTTQSLGRRPDTSLVFDPAGLPDDLPVMLDTNVYIARTAKRIPAHIDAFVTTRTVLHSGVALAELSISAGLLDPADPRTPMYRNPLRRLLDSIRLADCRSPSPASWVEAGMLAGILARTQLGLAKARKGLSAVEACCQAGRRRDALNDALIFLTAREHGAILISSNIADMDRLAGFRPGVELLLFRQTAPT